MTSHPASLSSLTVVPVSYTHLLSQNDQRYAENLRKVSGREVRIDQGIKLGGLSITDSVQGFIIDKTLDGSLEDQKKSFSSKYSFKYEG